MLCLTDNKLTTEHIQFERECAYSQDFRSPRVPYELLDRIVELAIAMPMESEKLLYSGPLAGDPFESIAAFSLASSNFRQIALRRYFRNVELTSEEQLKSIINLLTAQKTNANGQAGGFAWVRSLHAPSGILSENPQCLVLFTHLCNLAINFRHEGLATQYRRFKKLFFPVETSSFGTNLSLLEMTNLPRIDENMLRVIARACPKLVRLHLTCTERLELGCCWVCFEDSLSCTVHSPIPDTFSDAFDLGRIFGKALMTLKNLTHLHLGIFLSDEDLLYSHIQHSMAEESSTGMADSSPRCLICESVTRDVRLRELTASLAIAQQLKALKTIVWSSFFGESPKAMPEDHEEKEEEDGDAGECSSNQDSDLHDCMKSTVWILRINGKIRVRRNPWK